MRCALMTILLLGVGNAVPAFAIVSETANDSNAIHTLENTGIVPTPDLSPEEVIELALRLLQNDREGSNEGVLKAFRFISPTAKSSIATIGPYIAMLVSSFREVLANRSHTIRRITSVAVADANVDAAVDADAVAVAVAVADVDAAVDDAEPSGPSFQDVELETNSSICLEMIMTSNAHEHETDGDVVDHAEDIASVIWCLNKQPQSNEQCPNCWLIHSIEPSQGMPGVPVMTITHDGVFVEYPNSTKRSSFAERCNDELKWAALAGCMFFASMVVVLCVVRTHLNKAKINVETLTEKIRLEHSTILYSPSKFTGMNWKLPKTPLENPLTPSPLKMGSSTQSLFGGNYDAHLTPDLGSATQKHRNAFSTTARALHRGSSQLSMDDTLATCSTPQTPSTSPTPHTSNNNGNDNDNNNDNDNDRNHIGIVHIPPPLDPKSPSWDL